MNRSAFNSRFILLDPYTENYIIINTKDGTYETCSTSYAEDNISDQTIAVINEVREYIGIFRHQLLMIVNSSIKRTELDKIAQKIYKGSKHIIKSIQYFSYETSFLSNNLDVNISYNCYSNNFGTFGFVAFLGEPITHSLRFNKDTPKNEILKSLENIRPKVIPKTFLTEREFQKYEPQKLWNKSISGNVNFYQNLQCSHSKIESIFLDGLIKYIERKFNLTIAST